MDITRRQPDRLAVLGSGAIVLPGPLPASRGGDGRTSGRHMGGSGRRHLRKPDPSGRLQRLGLCPGRLGSSMVVNIGSGLHIEVAGSTAQGAAVGQEFGGSASVNSETRPLS
ncbi:hypothetical protein ACIBU0_25600 [Streptomyces sp. NPDC049627]|uniref:hypothetical protein n=1 Tax=Streptomyces sp. NPDC049627 TaxID=3365595 RepID=UPI0037B39EA2